MSRHSSSFAPQGPNGAGALYGGGSGGYAGSVASASTGTGFGGVRAKGEGVEEHLARLRNVSKALMQQLNVGAAAPELVLQGIAVYAHTHAHTHI